MAMQLKVSTIIQTVQLTSVRERVMNKDKCRYCKEVGYLVLSTAIGDEVCEMCGKWQDAILNSAWAKVGVA